MCTQWADSLAAPIRDLYGKPKTGFFYLRIPRKNLAFATASFVFARVLIEKLSIHLSTPPELLQVLYCNCYHNVTSDLVDKVTWKDSAEPSLSSVLSETYCQVCLKLLPDPDRADFGMDLTGLSMPPESGSVCHGSDCVPQILQLNTLHQHWDKVNTPGMREALRSAKIAWIGLLYFSRSNGERAAI